MESRLSGRDVAFDMPVDADEESAWQAPQQYLEDQSMDPAMVVSLLITLRMRKISSLRPCLP